MAFSGFPPEAIQFYEELGADNSRTFWADNKTRFGELVKQPMTEMTEALDDYGPFKMFRPHNDLRFSKNKPPYKTHQGAPGGGSQPVTCSHCRGQGRVRQVRQSLLGQMVTEGVCPHCRGKGSMVQDPCHSCNGTGTVRGEEQLEIKVPAGVSSGNYMELEGKGDAGEHGSRPGHLRVVFEVSESDLFERHGDDLLIDVPVSPVDLMLGTKVEVPTLEGKVALKIPAGTQSHKVFRMRGKEIPHVNRPGTGDQLVRVLSWTPEKLDKNTKKQLETVREALAAKVPQPGRHLFD